MRTERNYILYVLLIVAGASIPIRWCRRLLLRPLGKLLLRSVSARVSGLLAERIGGVMARRDESQLPTTVALPLADPITQVANCRQYNY